MRPSIEGANQDHINQAARMELARRNLADFICYTKPNYQQGWFNRELCRVLDRFVARIERGENPRLLVLTLQLDSGASRISRRFSFTWPPVASLQSFPEFHVLPRSSHRFFLRGRPRFDRKSGRTFRIVHIAGRRWSVAVLP